MVNYPNQLGQLTNSNWSFNHVNLYFINFKLGIHLGQPGHSYRSTGSFNMVNWVIYLGQRGQLTKSTWSFIQVNSYI